MPFRRALSLSLSLSFPNGGKALSWQQGHLLLLLHVVISSLLLLFWSEGRRVLEGRHTNTTCKGHFLTAARHNRLSTITADTTSEGTLLLYYASSGLTVQYFQREPFCPAGLASLSFWLGELVVVVTAGEGEKQKERERGRVTTFVSKIEKRGEECLRASSILIYSRVRSTCT